MSQTLRVVLVYCVVAILWIILSDSVALGLFGDSLRAFGDISTLKGLFFVMVSAGGLYAILRHEFRIQEKREVAAQEAERQFRHLFAQSPVPMLIYDPVTWRYLAVNDAAVNTYGYSRDEFLSMRISDIRPPEDVEKLKVTVGDTSRYLRPPTIWRHIYKDGSLHYVETVGNQVDYEGQSGVLVAVHDVTKSYLLQQELLEVNQRLQIMIDSSPLAIVAADFDRMVTVWNAAAARIFGWTADEIMGKPVPYIPPEGDGEALGLRARVLGGEIIPQIELKRMRKDGTRIDVRTSLAPLRSADGQIIGRFGMIQDITAEKQAMQQIAELAAIVQASGDAIIGKTLDGVITSWNSGAYKLYGYTAEEMIGATLDNLIPSDRKAELADLFALVRRGESVRQLETVRLHKNGAHIHVSLSVFPILKDGQPVAAAAIARDITERKRAEQQIAYQASLLKNVSDAIIALDMDWCITSWNRGAEVLYGWAAGEVLGKPVVEVLRPEYDDGDGRTLKEFLETGQTSSEATHHRKDGTPLRIMNSTSAIRDAEGNLVGAVGINRDVTRQRELEAQARESERLRDQLQREIETRTMRSRFLSMVSHEFRTPLAVIQSATDLLRHYDEQMSPERKALQLEQIQQQVTELNELLNEFLILSRMESVGIQFDPEETDVVEVCQQIVAAARSSWQTHPIEFISDGTCPVARLDRKLFQQAVRNIIGNAIKYSPEGSPVTLRVACQNGDLLVEIKDRGIGIPEEEQARLFEPFFRASNVGSIEGTGLGLAIVQRAVEAHRGKVQIVSRVGQGSAVTFMLPQVPVDAGA